MNRNCPSVVNKDADGRFREHAVKLSLDPDYLWIGQYVEYEWNHFRHIFETACGNPSRHRVLEFGSNVGATSIVLAALGAKVSAVDIDANYIELASLNAERYGFAKQIEFCHVEYTRQLPFDDMQFDYITCNSVLEYVPYNQLKDIQRELDRILKPGGRILISGTSNRLWPKEVHSRAWFVNYLPRVIDNILYRSSNFERGVFPWQLLWGFGDYFNVDRQDCSQAYLQAKSKMGISISKQNALNLASRILCKLGISIGLLAPSIGVTLEKKV